MTRDEALAVAREVLDGKTRSYVGAARALARHVVDAAEREAAALEKSGVEPIEAFDASVADGLARIAAKRVVVCKICGKPTTGVERDSSQLCWCPE